MALVVTQSIVAAGTTPAAITPTASPDTIADASFGPTGIVMRVITTGTATNVAVLDPGATPQGNPGTVTPVAAPATGVRMVFVPRASVAPGTGLATVTFSGALTGVTYELYRI